MEEKKGLFYYSPLIPVIGFIIHFFWIIFNYDICSAGRSPSKFVVMFMFIQGFSMPIIYYILKK
jgi:hypothetical protein